MIEIKDYIKLSKAERQQHLNLNEPCHYRGTISTQLRGLLAYYLDTNVPSGRVIDCCHVCHNGDCSNPKHLYWGTRKENIQDMLDSPQGNIFRKKCSDNKKGIKNPCYNINPWRNVTVLNSLETIEAWKKSQYIYEEYFLKKWDITKYNQGRSFFYNKYKIPRGPFQTMFRYFNNGWVPIKDEDWLNFCKEFV